MRMPTQRVRNKTLVRIVLTGNAPQFGTLTLKRPSEKNCNDANIWVELKIRTSVGGVRAMKSRIGIALIFALSFAAVVWQAVGAADEYDKHFGPLGKLSIAVAEAMPADKYDFRPHPDSMTFGQLMSHIATTNFQFCAGLKDSAPPSLPSPTGKDAVVKFLSDSFDYCGAIISNLTSEQLGAPHNSPDGRMPGRDVLLAMYIHVAHHRGQAEIYLRDNGIVPPQYRI